MFWFWLQCSEGKDCGQSRVFLWCGEETNDNLSSIQTLGNPKALVVATAVVSAGKFQHDKLQDTKLQLSKSHLSHDNPSFFLAYSFGLMCKSLWEWELCGIYLILRGEALLLSSAAEVVHRHPLHIGADLDVVRIRNQVRETCEQDTRSDYSHVRVSQSQGALLSLIGSSANGREMSKGSRINP